MENVGRNNSGLGLDTTVGPKLTVSGFLCPQVRKLELS